jgi:hypothetical protein
MPIPNESPLVLSESMVCSACAENMRRVIDKSAKGRFQRVVYYCDNCKYGFAPTPLHALGVDVKYVPAVEGVICNIVEKGGAK